MGEIIRFERKKTDIENLYRGLDSLGLDYQNIVLIRVIIEKQKYIRLKDGTRTLEGIPWITCKKPSKEFIYSRLEEYFGRFNKLFVSFPYGQIEYEFDRYCNYVGIYKGIPD